MSNASMLILGDLSLGLKWAEMFNSFYEVTLCNELDSDFSAGFRLVEGLDSLIENEENFDIVLDLHHDATLKTADLFDFSELILPETLVLTNTTSITATAVSSMLSGHDLVMGVSLYSGMETKLSVEICKSFQASSKALRMTEEIFSKVGKKTFLVTDSVGLISLRTISCLVNEAVFALQENVASVEDIDQSMMLGTNYPQGPLKWADQIGLDVILSCLDGLYEEYHDDRYRTASLLRQMVRASQLGIKTGKGFYSYQN